MWKIALPASDIVHYNSLEIWEDIVLETGEDIVLEIGEEIVLEIGEETVLEVVGSPCPLVVVLVEGRPPQVG